MEIQLYTGVYVSIMQFSQRIFGTRGRAENNKDERARYIDFRGRDCRSLVINNGYLGSGHG